MSAVACRTVRGPRVYAELAHSTHLGRCQGRTVVVLPGGEVGVYEPELPRLVVFDTAALVALASAEVLDSELAPITDRAAGMAGGLINPPSRL